MSELAVGAIAAGLFAVSAGTAAAVSWHTNPTLSTGGGSFTSGQYAFWPSNQNHGAFEWAGNLNDGKQKQSVPLDQLNWDGAALHTDDAYIRVCRDKGSLNPDNCSSTKHYQR
ncbi:hypothetical protein ABT189_17885 [Streptomyces sp900105755]|uniref:hypothetical protein n=1 Tax=Streptomyces sp. 900105755 TaxID=3154389 RepID=UPI0033309F2C